MQEVDEEMYVTVSSSSGRGQLTVALSGTVPENKIFERYERGTSR